MGLWLGFQHPSPFERIKHYSYPEEGWEMAVRQRGRLTRYSCIPAMAVFGESERHGVIDANDYTEHPGHIGLFARVHLKLLELDRLPEHRLVMDAKQVQELLGENND